MTKPEAKKGKRPGRKFEPTVQQRIFVSMGMAGGIPQEMMAAAIINPESGKHVSINTFKKAFPTEIAQAKTEADARIVGKLYEKAINGDTAALIFWCKSRLGWSEKVKVAHGGDEAAPPVRVDVRAKFKNLPKEVLSDMLRAMEPVLNDVSRK